MPDNLLNLINLFTNVVMLGGCGLIVVMLLRQKRQNELLQSVLAPKTGIEAYLNTCAQVVDNDPDGTCVVDDKGKIVLVNRKLEDISGYHRSEMVGEVVEILVPEALRGMHGRHRGGFIDSPSSRPMRGLVLRHKRGREVAVEIRLNRYMDISGGFTIAKVRIPEQNAA